MKNYVVQSVAINASYDKVFNFIASPNNLPQWAHAFKEVSDRKAMLETPQGSVEIGLKVNSSQSSGTIDWIMTFPDGKEAVAYSRVVDLGASCGYVFILTAPPVPLEQLEGALEQQSKTLQTELAQLRELLSEG